MSKKNLVMGVIKHYSWYIVEPFVRSFMKYRADDTEMVLFVEDISGFTHSRLEAQSNGGVIKLESFPDELKNTRPNFARWSIYLKYLDEHGDNYVQVLAADTRDVIFQGDIFKEFADRENFIGYAVEADNIRGNKTGNNSNYRWITASFGKAEAEFLADKSILCAGTIIATVEEMKILCRKMAESIPAVNDGHDQPTYLHVIYNHLINIKDFIPLDCENGAILSAGFAHMLKPLKFDDKFIHRGDGGIPAVVHQYDISKDFISLVNNLYRDKDFQSDDRFTDPKSVVEQMYFAVKYGKFSNALKFFATNAISKKHFEKYGDDFIDILMMMPTNNTSADAEMLELMLQYSTIGAFADGVNLTQLNKLYIYVAAALKVGKTVNKALKNFLLVYLFEWTKTFMKNGDMKQATVLIEGAIDLDIKLPAEFYLLQSEICRKTGDKDKALEAYKNFLDLM